MLSDINYVDDTRTVLYDAYSGTHKHYEYTEQQN